MKASSEHGESPWPTPSPAAEISPRVATFYSYKGGVGRSMAVANIAFLLARDYNLRVVAVDWDLEAPGLHRYFNMSDADLGEGIIDYLHSYKTLVKTSKAAIKSEDLSIKPYLRKIYEFEGGGSLRLLGAGLHQTKADYVEKVRTFDWEDFYREWNGAQVIEALRKEFLEEAQVTLIDSRTGITDVGGVCTVQLPDIVVFVFVFNEQNFGGIQQIATELSDGNNPSLKALNRRPELLFLPSRKELSELTRLREWEAKAADRFAYFSDPSKTKKTYGNFLTYLRKASLPYVPYFAYGEELAARSEKGVELAEAFDPLIGLLLGEDVKTALTVARPKGLMPRRRNITYIGVLVVSAALVAFFLLAEYFSPVWWGARVAGAVGGILGASLYVIGRFRSIARESPWKLSFGYVALGVIETIISGSLGGYAATVTLPPNRYSLIISIAAGFLLRPFLQNLTNVFGVDDSSRKPT